MPFDQFNGSRIAYLDLEIIRWLVQVPELVLGWQQELEQRRERPQVLAELARPLERDSSLGLVLELLSLERP